MICDRRDDVARRSHDDEDIVRRYVELHHGKGAHLVFNESSPDRDEILNAGLESARDYFKESLVCRRADGMPFRVYATLVDTIKPNAFATERRGLHICGMNVGLYVAMFELCNYVMAQPGMFTEIGDPDREVGTPLPEGVIPGFWVLDQTRAYGTRMDPSLAPTIIPKCPDRYFFAALMTLHMMRFVWFHELYHCLNGHVGALRRFERDAQLNEFENDSSSTLLAAPENASRPCEPAAFMHALELDADRSALWAAFQTQQTDKENIVALRALGRPTRMKLCMFTAYLMTHLMDETSRRMSIQKSSTHPDSYTRTHNLIRTTATHMIDAEPNVRSSLLEVINEYRSLKHQPPVLFNLNKIFSDFQTAPCQNFLNRKEAELDVSRRLFSVHAFK